MSAVIATTAGERNRVIGLVGAGHFYSHFSGLILPPLFPLLKQEFGVSYVALGSIVAAYSITTSVGQIPVGFLVDKIGGRTVLLFGLALLGASFALVGVTTAFWPIVVLAGLAGLGNSVFHPADYAILAARVQDSVLGRAMSVHSFLGYIGWAAAPPFMLGIAELAGWRVAVIAAGLVGIAITLVLLWQSGSLDDTAVTGHAGAKAGAAPPVATIRQGLVLMRSMPMVMMFVFFLLTSITVTGFYSFAIVAVASLYGTGEVVAGHALTGYMVAMAVGVLVGGVLADWTPRHNLVSSFALVGSGLFTALVGGVGGLFVLAVLAMVMAGLLMGIVSPSRDLMVRAATPPGSIGVAFGFTSTGFGLGNFIGPLACGWILDAGRADLAFVMLGAVSILAVVAVVFTRVPAKPSGA